MNGYIEICNGHTERMNGYIEIYSRYTYGLTH